MCGIAGYWDPRLREDDAHLSTLSRMAQSLRHRGPDDKGIWRDISVGIGICHSRLAIVDVSPSGHQPMESFDGRYIVAFNGEIYNYEFIREELTKCGAAPAWRGHSDTEVMLAAIGHWGFAATLEKLVGAFAIALWDKQERTLYLARDRIGEKPLYYGWIGNAFAFASELKALRAHPQWRSEVDRDALALYVRYSCVPAPYSIYKNIFKLLPGTYIRHSVANVSYGVTVFEPIPYWSAKHVAETGLRHTIELSDDAAVDQLDSLLKDSIGLQMLADVPLGAFLSGGIDSSTVVALMQAQSSRPVKTFTIGFAEDSYNEANHALAVARHLGTEHTQLYVSPADALAVIPKLPTLYDEPFSDSSQIPTYLVAKLAREHVAVSLSGDGGDELFGGYNRHSWGASFWEKIKFLSPSVRGAAARAATSLSPQRWDTIFAGASNVLPAKFRQRTPGEKIHKLAGLLTAGSPKEMYRAFVTHWGRNELTLTARDTATVLIDQSEWPLVGDFAQQMMYQDLVSYLPDDILVKVDRASMGVSLETRAPFLDHRLVEFAWRLPREMKIRNGQGKWALRQVLYRYVPKGLVERPKMGFGVPIDVWLRGPLRDWAEALLDELRLRQEGYFNPVPIREKWTQHLSGKRNWQYHLWDILMFQAWLEEEQKHMTTPAKNAANGRPPPLGPF
jgi:asparagine synthase (glutamine-hydrolysing)